MAFIYSPEDKFGYKDTLPEGHPEKVIKGSEFDDVFNNISSDSQGTSDALVQEIAARIAGDARLQKQIDEILLNGGGGGGGDGSEVYVKWADVKEKPAPIAALGNNPSFIRCGTYNSSV
jgi:hypothetical protein